MARNDPLSCADDKFARQTAAGNDHHLPARTTACHRGLGSV